MSNALDVSHLANVTRLGNGAPPASGDALDRAERCALAGDIHSGNGELPPAIGKLSRGAPESYLNPILGKIAVATRSMREQRQAVHFESVGAKVGEPVLMGRLETSVLPIYLAELEAESAVAAFEVRRAQSVFDEASNQLRGSPGHAAVIVSGAIRALNDLTAEQGTGGLTIRTPDEILAMTFDDGDRILGDRLLAKGQSLVIAGQGGLGKSRLLLQFIAAQRAGLPFVSFETRQPEMTWLVLQAENSNRRLQQDLTSFRQWIGEKHWPQVQAGIHIHTLEADADNFLSLDNEQTQARIRELIARIKPDGVAWDSLYNFGIGNLSSDEDMTGTLLAIARLSRAGNPQRAILALHHALTGLAGASRATGFDRASFGRNSKVLFQWTRGQINVAPGKGDSNEVLVVSCGKCSNGKEFPQFAVRLDPETMIYAVDEDFDLGAWLEQVSGKKESAEPAITPERVNQLCKPAMAKADLSKAIQKDCGCSRQMSYKHMNKAERQGKIKWNQKAEHYNPT